jgi:hypothetical protein
MTRIFTEGAEMRDVLFWNVSAKIEYRQVLLKSPVKQQRGLTTLFHFFRQGTFKLG